MLSDKVVIPIPTSAGKEHIVCVGKQTLKVNSGKGGAISCNRHYGNKTTKLCAHTIAVAEFTNTLRQKGNRKRINNAKIAPTNFVDILDNDCANVISPTFCPPVSQFAYLPAVNRLDQPIGPLLQNVPSRQTSSFCLKWVYNTTVSKCYGCTLPIQNPSRDVNEALIVMYRDYRSFLQNGMLTWTNNPENVHFHLNRQCIQLRYPAFLPNTLVVPQEFIQHLNETQKLILLNEFGLPVV